MDSVSTALWLRQLNSQDQVEQLLRAEEQNTPDKAAVRIDALKTIVGVQSTYGQWSLFGGIILAVIGVPLMLLFIGFPMFAIGIWMIWAGSRQIRKAKINEAFLNGALAAHLEKLSARG